jgi:hypothetical protein
MNGPLELWASRRSQHLRRGPRIPLKYLNQDSRLSFRELRTMRVSLNASKVICSVSLVFCFLTFVVFFFGLFSDLLSVVFLFLFLLYLYSFSLSLLNPTIWYVSLAPLFLSIPASRVSLADTRQEWPAEVSSGGNTFQAAVTLPSDHSLYNFAIYWSFPLHSKSLR